MSKQDPTTPAPGWKGGFAESNPEFAYPHPNINSVKITDNLANIDQLTRMQKVMWPQFSWETVPGDPSSRCFQMFAPDISRLGYDDKGRSWSVICPQQGTAVPKWGAMNVEVTVTGQRGWVDESSKSLYAEIMVSPKIWFTPGSADETIVKIMRGVFNLIGQPFPISKDKSIRLETFRSQYYDFPNGENLEKHILPIRDGSNPRFEIPDFARHDDVAWALSNLEVEISDPYKTGHLLVDEFSDLVMTIFNLAAGNMLASGNVLSWNVWFTAPELVDQKEWADHAELWRKSIDADHGSPEGPGTSPQYFDGSPFHAGDEIIPEIEFALKKFLDSHSDNFALRALNELEGWFS